MVVGRRSTVSIKALLVELLFEVWKMHHYWVLLPLWGPLMDARGLVIEYCFLVFVYTDNSLKLILKKSSQWRNLRCTWRKRTIQSFQLGLLEAIWKIHFKQILLSGWSKAVEFQKCRVFSPRAGIETDWTETLHNICSRNTWPGALWDTWAFERLSIAEILDLHL